MKPKRPPLIDETECLELLNTSRKEYDLKVQELLAKDVYYSYCDLTVRSGKLKTTALWYLFKQIREYQFKTVCEFSDEPTLARFIITDKIHQTISEIDKYTTNAALDEMTRQIDEERYFKFLINLFPISSTYLFRFETDSDLILGLPPVPTRSLPVYNPSLVYLHPQNQ